MRLVKVLILVTVVALMVPQVAAAADTKSSFGVLLGYISPTGNSTLGGVKFEADSTMAAGLAYQYSFNEKFSLGASLLYAKYDFNMTGSGFSNEKCCDATFMPLLLDGNFHLLKNTASVDFYLGPTGGYAMWGDSKGVDGGSEKLKNNFVYGLNLGLDVPFQASWAFNAGLRYLKSKAESDEVAGDNIDVDPWILTAGVSYRF
jgi:outer membrane protein W